MSTENSKPHQDCCLPFCDETGPKLPICSNGHYICEEHLAELLKTDRSPKCPQCRDPYLDRMREMFGIAQRRPEEPELPAEFQNSPFHILSQLFHGDDVPIVDLTQLLNDFEFNPQFNVTEPFHIPSTRRRLLVTPQDPSTLRGIHGHATTPPQPTPLAPAPAQSQSGVSSFVRGPVAPYVSIMPRHSMVLRSMPDESERRRPVELRSLPELPRDNSTSSL